MVRKERGLYYLCLENKAPLFSVPSILIQLENDLNELYFLFHPPTLTCCEKKSVKQNIKKRWPKRVLDDVSVVF